MAFEQFTDSLKSAWGDIKNLPSLITKSSPGQPYTPPASAATTPVSPDDPYNLDFYLNLTAAQWAASGDWLTRKLKNDYAAGRFTAAQYNQIVQRAKDLGSSVSLMDTLKAIGTDVSKSAGAYAQSVAQDVAANGILGGGGGSVIGYIFIALGGLLVLRLLFR